MYFYQSLDSQNLDTSIFEQILELYRSVNWLNYTNQPNMLKNALKHSLCNIVVSESSRIVGIIRVVGDGHSIIYVQDLIVHPDFQRQGIGKALLNAIDLQYPEVYQKVLLTDASATNALFYESCGYANSSSLNCTSYLKITRPTKD